MTRDLKILIPVGVAGGIAGAIAGSLPTISFLEEHYFAHLNAACVMRPAVPDLGPPGDCNEGSQPHTRTIHATPLAISTSTASTATISHGIYYVKVLFDADDVRPLEQRMPYVNFAPPPITPRST